MNSKEKMPVRPMFRIRDSKTGEALPVTPELLKVAAKSVHRSLTKEEEARIAAQKRAQVQEHAQRQAEALQRAEAQLTTLDTASIPGQFNTLFATLCELNPDFILTPETTLNDLYRAVIHAQPNWFGSGLIAEEDFWDVLKEKGIPECQYFTTRDQITFIKKHPNREAEGYSLRELRTWLGKNVVPRGYQLPNELPQPTFIEARTVGTAISDGRDLRDWQRLDGVLAMLHAPKGSTLQTRFEPGRVLLSWWGRPAEVQLLEAELQNLEFDAVLLFFTSLSLVIENGEVDTSIDALIAAIGRDEDARRSQAARKLWRGKLWRWLMLFDSMAIIGARPGVWREPRSVDSKRPKMPVEKLYSNDPLLIITGQRGTEQPSFDNSAIPKEVSIAGGRWLREFRGNREFLSKLGNVRAIAAIRRGQPSGDWACCIGLILIQLWREQATKASHHIIKDSAGNNKSQTLKFRPFTRRELLQTWRPDNDVLKILKSDKPHRAKNYWIAAIQKLRGQGVIGFYKELEPLSAGRKDWQDKWLEQPLDIRPIGDVRKDTIEINKEAKVAREQERKRKPRKSGA
jgi:hypothetical protein